MKKELILLVISVGVPSGRQGGSPPSLGISSDITENDAGEPPVPRNGKPEATWVVSVGSRFSLSVIFLMLAQTFGEMIHWLSGGQPGAELLRLSLEGLWSSSLPS